MFEVAEVVGVVRSVRSNRRITYYSQFYSYIYPHKIWNRVSNVVTLQSETKKYICKDCG